MSKELSLKIKNAIEESMKLKELILEEELYIVLIEMGKSIIQSIQQGGKVLVCGNGGSASNANHLKLLKFPILSEIEVS